MNLETLDFDLSLARLCADSYVSPPTWARDDIAFTLREIDDLKIVTARGSDNIENWARDFAALPVYDPWLGWCHGGFLDGALKVAYQIIADMAGEKVVFNGHSLGGPLTIIVAAMMVKSGHTPAGIVTFEAARAGTSRLAAITQHVPVRRQYWNGNDPVPDLPPPPLFSDLVPPTCVGAAQMDRFACHPIAAVIASLEALRPALLAQGLPHPNPKEGT